MLALTLERNTLISLWKGDYLWYQALTEWGGGWGGGIWSIIDNFIPNCSLDVYLLYMGFIFSYLATSSLSARPRPRKLCGDFSCTPKGYRLVSVAPLTPSVSVNASIDASVKIAVYLLKDIFNLKPIDTCCTFQKQGHCLSKISDSILRSQMYSNKA